MTVHHLCIEESEPRAPAGRTVRLKPDTTYYGF